MSIQSYFPSVAYTSDAQPKFSSTFIQTNNQIVQDERRLEEMVGRSLAYQENLARFEKAKDADEFYKRFEQYATGELSQDDVIAKIVEEGRAVFKPYYEAKDDVTQQSAAANMQTFFGMNARGYQAQYAGTQTYVDFLKQYLPKEQQEQLARYTAEVEQGLGSTAEDGYGVWTGIKGFFSGLVSDYGTSAFVPGGTLHSMVYEVDQTWKNNKKLQNTVVSLLLDPNTEMGQANRMLGLTEEDIRAAPSIPGLVVSLNARKMDYNAGQALGVMSTSEHIWQFVKDTGVGILTDPDSLVEFGVTAAAIPFTGGASLGAYASRRTALSLAAKAASSGRKLGAMYKLARGAERTFTASKRAVTVARKGLVPTAWGEEIVFPAIQNYRRLRVSHADEIAEAARKIQVEGIGNKSILFESFKRTMLDIDPPATKLGYKILANAFDGASGELLAYSANLDDMYDWQKLVYGDSIDYQDFEFSFKDALVSMGMGAGFGVALGGIIRLANGGIRGLSELGEITGKDENGNPKNFFTHLREVREKNALDRERNILVDGAKRVSGMEVLETAIEHFHSTLEARGQGDPETKAIVKQMLEYAFESGVDLHRLIREGNYDLIQVANHIKMNEDTIVSKSRKNALILMRKALAGNDPESIKVVERITNLTAALNRERINQAVDNDVLPTDVNSFDILVQVRDANPDSELGQEAQRVLTAIETVAMNRAELVANEIANLELYKASPDFAVGVINTMLERLGIDKITVEEYKEAFKKAAQAPPKVEGAKAPETPIAPEAPVAEVEDSNVNVSEFKDSTRDRLVTATELSDIINKAEQGLMEEGVSLVSLEGPENGPSKILRISGRLVVVVDVDGEKFAFYQSSGKADKEGVPSGAWYPFGGFGVNSKITKGWFAKTTKGMMSNYGSVKLKRIGNILNKAFANEDGELVYTKPKGNRKAFDAFYTVADTSELETRVNTLLGMEPWTDETWESMLREKISRIETPKAPEAPIAPEVTTAPEAPEALTTEGVIEIVPDSTEPAKILTNLITSKDSKKKIAQGSMDAVGVTAIINEAANPASVTRNMTTEVLEAVRTVSKERVMGDHGTIDENDASNPKATFTPKEMARITKENLDKYIARIPQDRLNEINAAVDEELKGITSYREAAALIYDIFKIDVGMARGVTAESKAPLDVEDMPSVQVIKGLYRTLRILKELPDEVGSEMDIQIKLARDVAAGIRSLLIDSKALGLDARYLPYDMVVKYLPAGRHNLLHTVFADAKTIDSSGQANVFDVELMQRIAFERLMRADELFAAKVVAKSAEVKAKEDRIFGGTIFNRTLRSTIAKVNRETFERQITTEEALQRQRHQERLQLAAAAHNISVDQLIERHKANAVQGILDAWSFIPDGPTKVALATRMGIGGLVYKNDAMFDRTRTGHVENELRQQLYDRVEQYIAEQIDQPDFKLQHLFDGTIDAAAGYHVGRAAIEAVEGTRDIGREIGKAFDATGTIAIYGDEPNLVRSGYLGTLDSKTLAGLHEDAVREGVAKYLIFQDEDMTTVRKFDVAQIEDILRYYDEIEKVIAENDREGWTEESIQEFMDTYVQDNPFIPDYKKGYAPQRLIRSIDEEIKNFRTRLNERVQSMRYAPPALIKTLHDEMAGPQSFFGSMFIVGQLPGAKNELASGRSGTVGMPSAQAVPGSVLQAWNIRASNMFGSVQGMSKIASLAGAAQLSNLLTSMGEGGRTKFLIGMADIHKLEFEFEGKTLKVKNSADASAQAVTFAQTIHKDYLAYIEAGELKPEQISFNEFLIDMKNKAMKHWGGKEFKQDIVDYLDHLAKSGDDNYSLVGIEALVRLKDHPAFKSLAAAFWNQIPESERPEKFSDLSTFKLGNTPLGLALRKEVFKRPVMTLPYSAGIKAFIGGITEGLSLIKDNPIKYGISQETADSLNPAQMANDLAILLYGENKDTPGLIEEVLDIPNSTQLREEIQLTAVARLNKIFEAAGEEFRTTLRPEDATTGRIYSDPVRRAELKKFAIRYLGLAENSEPETLEDAGMWVFKQLLEVRNGTLSYAQFLKTCHEMMRFMAADPAEKGRWRAVSSYISTAEMTSRMGFIAVQEQVKKAFMEIGVDPESLSPEAKAAYLHGIAHYMNKATGFGRAYSAGGDVSISGRDISDETTTHGSINIGDVQLGQYRLADGFEGLFGVNVNELEGPEYVNALRSAVLLDMMMESSSIFLPPPLRGDHIYDAPSLGQFTMSAGDDASVSQRTKLANVAQTVDEKIADFEKRYAEASEAVKLGKLEKVEDAFSPSEITTWGFIVEMRKNILQRDEKTNRMNTIRNNTWIAADIQSRYRIDRPNPNDLANSSDKTIPTKVGIPFLRATRERMHAKPDPVPQDGTDALNQAMPFSVYELETASPISPTYTERVLNTGPSPVIREAGVDTYADEFVGETSEAQIAVEIEAEQEQAKKLGTTVTGNRGFRLAKRIAKRMRNNVRRIHKLDISPEEKKRQTRAAIENNLRELKDSLVATFGGTNPKDAEERGLSEKLDIPAKGRAIGRRRRGKTRTVLSALQQYGRINRIDRLVGLALGAVPYSNLRILNPKLDNRKAKAEANKTGRGQTHPLYQVTNKVPAVTPRGPMSIFFRDWTLMGGSHIDASKNMIRYIYERTLNEDGSRVFNSFQDAADYVVRRGIFTVWAETVQKGLDTVDEAKFLDDLALFSEQTRNELMFDYTVSGDTVAKLEAEFNRVFEEGVVRHGLNPRTLAVLPSGEERMVFLEILENLSDPSMMQYFKNVTGLEDVTPEMVAVMFMEPESRENLAFLPVYEIELDEKGNPVPKLTTWGDIVNGMVLTDMKTVKGALPIWTELEILNMLNTSGNREIVRKIMLANRFGIDIDVELTNSQRLDTARDRFGNNRVPYHGFLNTPTNDETALTLIEQGKAGNGYNAEEHGAIVYSSIREGLASAQNKQRVLPSVSYGIAEMLRSAGILLKVEGKPTKDGKPRYVNVEVDEELLNQAINMLKGDFKVNKDDILEASRQIGLSQLLTSETRQAALSAEATAKNTEMLAIEISKQEPERPQTSIPIYDKNKHVLALKRKFKTTNEAHDNKPNKDALLRRLNDGTYVWIEGPKQVTLAPPEPVTAEPVFDAEARTTELQANKVDDLISIALDKGYIKNKTEGKNLRKQGLIQRIVDEEQKAQKPKKVSFTEAVQKIDQAGKDVTEGDVGLAPPEDETGMDFPDYEDLVASLNNQRNNHVHKPLPEVPVEDRSVGNAYLRLLDAEFQSGKGIEYENMALLFKKLTGRDQTVNNPMGDTEAIGLIEYAIVNDTMRKALFGGGKFEFGDDSSVSMQLEFDPQRIRTIFNGLGRIRSRAKLNVPAAAYVLIHELVERMFAISRTGERVSQDNKYGVVTKRLKLMFVREFVNERGRKMFRTALKEIGFKDSEIGPMFDKFVAFQKTISPNLRNKLDLTGNISDLNYDQALRISNDFSFAAREEGPTADVITEGITQYLTFILFKRGVLEGTRLVPEDIAQADALRGLAKSILATLRNIRDNIARVGKYARKTTKGPASTARSLFLGDIDKPQRAKKGVEFAETAGNQFMSFEPMTEAYLEGLELLNAVAERSVDVMSGVDLEPTDAAAFRYRKGRLVRNFGGDVVTKEDAEAELAKVELELRSSKLGEDNWYSLIKKRDYYRKALQETKMFGDEDVRLKELLQKATPTPGSFPDLRLLSTSEKAEVERHVTSNILRQIKVDRMNQVARMSTFAATFASAASGGMYNVRGSQSFAIRALGSMLNPSGVNTTEALPGYIPVQFTQDMWETNLAKTRNYLSSFNVFMRKTKKKNAQTFRKIHDVVQFRLEQLAKEQITPEDAIKYLSEAGLPMKAIAGLIEYQKAFLSRNGFYLSMVNAAADTGLISDKAAAKLRRAPRLPFMLDRDYLDVEENFVKVVEDMRQRGVNKQRALLTSGSPQMSVDLLEDTGILWHQDKPIVERMAEFNEWTPRYIQIWNDLAGVVVDYLPKDWENLSPFEQVQATMDIVQQATYAPSSFIKLVGESTETEVETPLRIFQTPPGKELALVLSKALEQDKPLAWSYSRGPDGKLEDGGKSPALQKYSLKEDERRRRRGDLSKVTYTDPGIGGSAARELVDQWRNGGSLRMETFLFDDPRFWTQSEKEATEWMQFQVTDVTALTNSLFGGNLAEAFHTQLNLGAFQMHGFNIRSMIKSLRAMVNSDTPLVPTEEGVETVVDKKRFLDDLQHLEDQLDVGLNRKPAGVESPTEETKYLHLLSRFGVTAMSAPNWAFSSLAETTQILADTLKRVILGDLSAVGDFFAPLSPKVKARLADQVNLSDYYLNRYNIGIRTGMYYLDEMADFDDSQGSALYSSLSNTENFLRSVATMGFGKANRYNRYIMARRAVRDLQKLVSKDKNLAEFIKQSQNLSIPEVRGLARKLGINPEYGVQLYMAGVNNPTLFLEISKKYLKGDGFMWDLFREDMYHIRKNNPTLANQYETVGTQVFSLLQYANTRLNLEPQMLSRQIPKTALQELVASLGQFPALALHQMKRSLMMGGLGGLSAWIIPFLLGEAMYGTVQEMVRGRSWDDIKEKWTNDPLGSSLQIFESLPFMGKMGQLLQPVLMQNAVQFIQRLADNPDLLAGYKSRAGLGSMGIPGLEMFGQWARDLNRTVAMLMEEDRDPGEIYQKLVRLTPLPLRQVSSIALQSAFAESPYAQYGHSYGKKTKSYNTRHLLNGVYSRDAASKSQALRSAAERMQATEAPTMVPEPQQAPQGVQTPPEPQIPQTKPTELTESLDQQQGPSSEIVDKLE